MSSDSGPDATAGADTDGSADHEVDAVDRRLVDALLADGRAGASDLAGSIGVPTAVARERCDRLEAAGVLEGYRPVVDYGALGYDVTAVFRLSVAGAGLETVVADLESIGGLVSVYEVTGADDVVAVGKFADTGALDATIKTLLTHDGVRDVATDVVREVVAEDAPLPVADAE